MVAQGVSTVTVDPTTPTIVVDQNWVNDILQLGTSATGSLMMRANVVADSNNNVAKSSYQQAFGLYSANNMAIHAVLPREFDNPSINNLNPNDPVPGLTNPYIDDFSFRAEDFAIGMQGHGTLSYFIWNEPNNQGQPNYLYEDRFAALMYQCYNRIKNGASGIAGYVYLGGLLWPYNPAIGNTPDVATNQVVTYLTGVYNTLLDNNIGASFGVPIPWDAVVVHPHHCGWSEQDMINLRSGIDNVFNPSVNTHPNVNTSDKRAVFAGEWGVTHSEAAQSGCMLDSFTYVRNHFDAMWYFQHHDSANTGCGNTGDVYGLVQYTEQNNTFEVTSRCSDWDQLHYLLQYPTP